MDNISYTSEPTHATMDTEQATSTTLSSPTISNPPTPITNPIPRTPVNFSRRLTKKRYSDGSNASQPPSPSPTAIHPALRPISVFSRSSSGGSSRSSTSGYYAYDAMSCGSRPSTSWTIGQGYESMRPGVLPNSDWTMGISYEEMRREGGGVAVELEGSPASSVVGGQQKKRRSGFLRSYKQELKQNFRAMDRAFSQY